MLSESDKTADHEMCTNDHGPFHCVRFASVRSVTTTLSGESGAAIWHRSDRDRKGFDPTFCKTSGCYSAKLRAVSATNTEAFACVIKAFSPVLSCVRTKSRRRFCRLKRRFELRLNEIAGGRSCVSITLPAPSYARSTAWCVRRRISRSWNGDTRPFTSAPESRPNSEFG